MSEAGNLGISRGGANDLQTAYPSSARGVTTPQSDHSVPEGGTSPQSTTGSGKTPAPQEVFPAIILLPLGDGDKAQMIADQASMSLLVLKPSLQVHDAVAVTGTVPVPAPVQDSNTAKRAVEAYAEKKADKKVSAESTSAPAVSGATVQGD